MKKSARYSKSRQKACQQCTKAKVRCDQNLNGCSRCLQRGYACMFMQLPACESIRRSDWANGIDDIYSAAAVEKSLYDFSVDAGHGSVSRTEMDSFGPGCDTNLPKLTTSPSLPATSENSHVYRTRELPTNQDVVQEAVIDFEDDLVCPINAQEISNRWLNAYIPTSAQTIKVYPPNIATFIYNMLKSYAAVIVHGRGVPPFIHSLQVASLSNNPQLSACLSLTRMCAKPVLGAEAVVAGVIEREMTKIYNEKASKDGRTLRATFQAYLVYAMVLYFCLKRDSKPFLRQAMVNLQELACASSQSGLVCLAERNGVRPRWEAWVAAESQRRTLYLMYLFDNLLSILDGLPTFLGVEIRGLPTPATKTLWHASTCKAWEISYNAHLADWSANGLTIDELWPAIDKTDVGGLALRRERVDRWLEGVDEFGTMLYAVTCGTHGN